MKNAESARMLRLKCAPTFARRPRASRLETLWIALVLLCSTLLGCSSPRDRAPSLGDGDGGVTKPPPMGGACETPKQGCECKTSGEVIDCGQVERVSGDYVSCSMGRRTCDDGTWGACVGDSIATLHVPAGQRRPELSSSRPHGRRDELRAGGRILRDLGASFEARAQARETLLELLEATRANGRPAYSLQLAAAKALMDDPAPFEPN